MNGTASARMVRQAHHERANALFMWEWNEAMMAPTPLRPLGLVVAVALLIGVSGVQLFPALPPLWLSAGLLLPAAWLYCRQGWLRATGALLLGIAWACLIGQWVMQSRWSGGSTQQDYRIEGRVLGLPLRDQDSVRFDLRVETGEKGAPIGEKIRLGWYQHALEIAPDIAPGSRWQLIVRLKRPHGVLNPGGYDFEKNALAQRLAATGYIRQPQAARLLENGQGIDFWRDQLSREVAQALPRGRGRFIQALALGDTRALTDEDWETLRATGLTHQIAISGFHVGMVAGFGALLMLALYRLLPRLGRRLPRPQASALGALVFALGYTALAGFALPTVRTLLMIAAVLLAKFLRRAQSGNEAFALALITVLLFDPLSVLAPGFWLSFLGVAWLMWCLPQDHHAGRIKPFLQAQGVAVLGLLPLTVWFFGQASIPGPLANLLGIPLISLVVVPLTLLGLLALPLSTTIAHGCWQAAAWVMERLWWLLDKIAHWPAAMVWLPEPSFIALILALVGAFWLLLPRGVPGKWLALLLLLPLLWPNINPPKFAEAQITVIDVGQGLSVLVRTANHALLYDAGPASERGLDFGEAAVVPALHALGVHRLDKMLISHGDNDHSGGLAAVQRAFPHTRVQAPEGWAKAGMSMCQRENAWQWDGVKFRILHPPSLFPYLRNDSSCVLRVEAGGHVALLPGDIGRHVEARLVREQISALRADLLIVPHHGSATSSSTEFIAAVEPRWAVMTTGAENRFHLPRADIVERYQQARAISLNTAQTGALKFSLNAQGLVLLENRRRDHAHYWHDTLKPGSGYAIASSQLGR